MERREIVRGLGQLRHAYQHLYGQCVIRNPNLFASGLIAPGIEAFEVLLAQFDALTVGVERLTRERDALLAGKWAGPWEFGRGRRDCAAVRMLPDGRDHIASAYEDGEWFSSGHGREATVDAAKAAADAALLAAGWFLADGGAK